MMYDKEMIAHWRVLVVDDEPDSLEVVKRVLTYYGATVFSASNGQEALDIITQTLPTLILSDLSMPIMDGWELRQQLQNDTRTKHIPVIALTAHAMSGDRERALGVGFHYYMTKPLSPFTFLEDLLKLLPDVNATHVQEAKQPDEQMLNERESQT